MIFRHISGTRATQVDIVTIGAHRELILGRASSAAIRFDSRGDHQVGRQHARIAWNLEEHPLFQLADLASRNGTYVNGQRIEQPVFLGLGDVVRLGATGPEIAVTWDVTSDLDEGLFRPVDRPVPRVVR